MFNCDCGVDGRDSRVDDRDDADRGGDADRGDNDADRGVDDADRGDDDADRGGDCGILLITWLVLPIIGPSLCSILFFESSFFTMVVILSGVIDFTDLRCSYLLIRPCSRS